MRLNRFLGRAGIASRRRSDALIRSGAIRVNGETVTEPGRSIECGRDRVEFQGRPVVLPETFEYIAFHKPRGYLVTRRDTHGRPTVFDQIPGLHSSTVAVGRLDLNTTGLLLLTNDGELAFRLAHPRFEIDKRYEAVVKGRPDETVLARLRAGVELEDGMTAPARVELHDVAAVRGGEEARLTLSICEGRKRQIRRMLRTVGHPVRALQRVAFAGLELDLPRPGQWRFLSPAEVDALKARVGLLEEHDAECAERKT
jgi:pseudouridine synthase